MTKQCLSQENEVENQIIDKLNEGLKAEIPEAMFRARVEQSIKDFDYRIGKKKIEKRQTFFARLTLQ